MDYRICNLEKNSGIVFLICHLFDFVEKQKEVIGENFSQVRKDL